MTTPRLRAVVQHLRTLSDGSLTNATSDEQLLDRYLASRDQDAFRALVRRYGPMVSGVCRRLLRHEQDTEDAFQAVFLVLARKASFAHG